MVESLGRVASCYRTRKLESAVVAVWHGKVVTVGHTNRLHGTLEQIIARSS